MKIFFIHENNKIISMPAVPTENDNFGEIDSATLKWGYDAELYTYENGTVVPKSEAEVNVIKAARETLEQQLEQEAVGNDVILQHIIQEKKDELQWDSSTQYSIGDVVYHNGSMWRATSNNSNNPPDDVPGDWERIE